VDTVLDATYVLPIKAGGTDGLEELAAYLRWLAAHCEVVVVDGSPPDVERAHADAWGDVVLHTRPDPDLSGLAGKVNGVVTGLRRAGHERVVIADDDVRYDDDNLHRIVALLDGADLVRPQNYFLPLPWHARWDTARSLLNRALGGDWPGTVAVRRSTVLGAGGYDGDVLFENLELVRTVRAAGGRVVTPLDLYVRRLPPTAAHFWSQRSRQAYDELARPAWLAAELTVLPGAVVALARKRWRLVAVAVATVLAAAETGRRRAGGRAVFPASSTLLAPLWLAERGLCAWLAVWARLRHGGVRWGDARLRRAATPERVLRRRLGHPAGISGVGEA
jgi:hypothetical protein